MIGALDENLLTNEYFIASHSYYHDELTWCVKKKQPIPLWKNIFHVCTDPIVWALHTFTMIACISTCYFIQQFEDMRPKWDWHRITFAGFCCCCGFPSEFNPKTTSQRLSFSCILLAFMILDITGLALMVKSITKPFYNDQIDSIKQIVDNSFELSGDKFALENIIKQTEVDHNIFHLELCS